MMPLAFAVDWHHMAGLACFWLPLLLVIAFAFRYCDEGWR